MVSNFDAPFNRVTKIGVCMAMCLNGSRIMRNNNSWTTKYIFFPHQ